MRNFGLPACFQQLAKYSPSEGLEVGPRELDRLRALEVWRTTGSWRLAASLYGVSRATLYRWKARLRSRQLRDLQPRSRRPHRVRGPQWSAALQRAVLDWRQDFPRWGKDKLAVMLQRQGQPCSVSTVGRILAHLKHHGRLVESPLHPVKMHKRPLCRPYAMRKPKDYPVQKPGDLVQVDTVQVRPLPGMVRKQFTGRDVISRWDVLEAHEEATSGCAARFLETLQKRCPFDIQAIQVDGGSEFMAEFEQECQKRAIRLFVLPPRSPKLNGRVERAHRTHVEEYYQVYECPWRVEELNKELADWESIYNCVRPHQALGYKTPLQILQQHGILPADSPCQSQMS